VACVGQWEWEQDKRKNRRANCGVEWFQLIPSWNLTLGTGSIELSY
jgi:hypothetical protein